MKYLSCLLFCRFTECKIILVCIGLLAFSPAAGAQEIKIYTGCNFIAQGAINVVVNNTAFKNNGSFTAGSSTVSFTGNTDTTASYINGTSNTRFYNLTLDKSAYGTAVKSGTGVKNILTVSAGKLYADSNLTLLSDVSNTARLAAVPSGANVFGKVMVERYFPSRRAWRLLTAPVTNSSSIYNSWQNGGVYVAGRGMLISGPSGTDGLDNSHAASLKTWDVSSQSLVAVSNTYNSISATNTGSADNTGYFAFVRGDRNTNNFVIPNSNVTTLTGIGVLQTGTQVFTVASTAGKYTLIGNPYASPVDFNAVSRTNVVKRFYVWDPTLNTLGGYVTLDDVDNDGIYSKSVAGSNQTKEIQSSQAFFVETNTTGAASLTFTESAKSSTNNLAVFRPVSDPTASVRVDLYLINADSTSILADGTLAEYNDLFDAGISNQDALKFGNINESVCMYRNATGLAIERRPLLNNNDTLFLKLGKTTPRNYQLVITPGNIDRPGLIAFLEDTYLQRMSLLSLGEETSVSFTVTTDAASTGAGRFRIVFKPAGVLPVGLVSLTAVPFAGNIKTEWKVSGESNVKHYTVERSQDGVHFFPVSVQPATGSATYTWLDKDPYRGTVFYRIKITDNTGAISYSSIAKVVLETPAFFTINPNPVKGRTAQLYFDKATGGTYSFIITNTEGQVLYTNKQAIAAGTTAAMLELPASLAAGVYQLQVHIPGGKTYAQKIIFNQ